MAAQNATGLFPVITPGPLPNLNGTSVLIGAGDASGLFPEITPSATPSPAPGSLPAAAGRSPAPAFGAMDFSTGSPEHALTAQVLGLIALAVAIVLVVTRLSLRRRTGRRGPGA